MENVNGQNNPNAFAPHMEFLFKIVIIGDPSTGKSSILRRYCENTFNDKYKCTIGVDFQIKVLKIENKIVKLQLWDTAGQERFKVMTKSYYRGARACCIVYDITRRSSFSNIQTWAEQYINNNALTSSSTQIMAIIGILRRIKIGNKSDMEHKREVQTYEGKELANSLGIFQN